MLGHGSLTDCKHFHKHFPVDHLYVSEDHEAFRHLPLHSGYLLDFIGPSALASAIPSAFKSLRRPGTLAAKAEQPLPGDGNFRQMGGQFLMGPGDACHFHHIERNPGAHLDIDDIKQRAGWD
eukprot:TRINITY_DN7420_c0_g1_i1.p1 TRINITY_DN7420_c0_g1~~TRINITY_DN7420_c0_g1_i1.p1  ORF type:complete len:122 (-),score=12.10 TRINITY_DN7420_c0_g1_i1:415-780(-)